MSSVAIDSGGITFSVKGSPSREISLTELRNIQNIVTDLELHSGAPTLDDDINFPSLNDLIVWGKQKYVVKNEHIDRIAYVDRSSTDLSHIKIKTMRYVRADITGSNSPLEKLILEHTKKNISDMEIDLLMLSNGAQVVASETSIVHGLYISRETSGKFSYNFPAKKSWSNRRKLYIATESFANNDNFSWLIANMSSVFEIYWNKVVFSSEDDMILAKLYIE